jgi:hypothetical protein
MERRRAVRHVACFPTQVERVDDKKATAMIADLSASGTRILLRNPGWQLGDELRLELYILSEIEQPRYATGRIVRIEPLPDAQAWLWTHTVGVEFHQPITLSASEVDALEKRKATLGVR